MAVRCTSGVVYDNLDIANPVSNQREKKTNTFVRVFNCCVHSDNLNRFIKLNDIKSRNDYESEGGNPVKSFWINISDQVNDSENDEMLSVFLLSGEDKDNKINDWVSTNVLNVVTFNQTTHETCGQMVRDMLKATDNIRAMKQSGHHSTEVWDYCRKTHLLVPKGVEIPANVAYYITKVVMSIEGLSGSFSSYLENDLCSDSESMPQDSGTDNLTTATASTSRSNSQQQQEAFLGSFQEYSDKTITAFESFQNKSNEIKRHFLICKHSRQRNWLRHRKLTVQGVIGMSMIGCRKGCLTCPQTLTQGTRCCFVISVHECKQSRSSLVLTKHCLLPLM
jgi:hypothetical protein